MRFLLVLLILGIEAWAITAVLGSRHPARTKVGWTLAIVLLPVVGVLAWIGRGTAEAQATRGRHE